MNRTNYIYIDYENARTLDLDVIANKPVKVILITGPQERKLPKEMIRFAELGQLSLVEVATAGKNAADFVLTYELAIRSAAEAQGFFHIVSRDKGFDAVVAHLKSRKILAARHDAFADIKFLQDEPVPSGKERAAIITEALSKSPKNRPANAQKLRSFINSRFGKKLTEAEIDKTIKDLQNAKALTVDAAGRVKYP